MATGRSHVELTIEATHVEEALCALRGRSQHQRLSSQLEDFARSDEHPDRRRAHELHSAQVDHEIVVERNRPSVASDSSSTVETSCSP
jgi:hypothetical protein